MPGQRRQPAPEAGAGLFQETRRRPAKQQIEADRDHQGTRDQAQDDQPGVDPGHLRDDGAAGPGDRAEQRIEAEPTGVVTEPVRPARGVPCLLLEEHDDRAAHADAMRAAEEPCDEGRGQQQFFSHRQNRGQSRALTPGSSCGGSPQPVWCRRP